MTRSLGRHTLTFCPRCAALVWRLPVLKGLIDADPGGFPIEQTPEADRLIVLSATSDDGDSTSTTTLCLRRHHCPAPPAGAATGENASALPRIGQSPAEPATRADYQLLNRLRTRAELVRSQALGTLRPHPGSRHHSPMELPRRAIETLGLSRDRCVLCRQPVAAAASIVVGWTEGAPAQTLRVHSPECPRRGGVEPQMDGPPDGP